ncbi:MAG: hypothetical protein A3F84_16125 [Candidatus Handelsmanbacteria bacterium RIFCSPLOWO2_12_FULL_64_10]|uniref:Uncharacterized protein n=1 Tax=Handelsmanbacteria sp. (strain RIFCSPLOWO2_12_FULL_64_10) TaxID=1817868 RepID=A0A1F6CL09_HANXR|nr:MAG: hypothetical protein A3F84_16125 [Candidatus Handelsmanbacteria bacterium RIFCSPLOWO2_12_FULL_64_10]
MFLKQSALFLKQGCLLLMELFQQSDDRTIARQQALFFGLMMFPQTIRGQRWAVQAKSFQGERPGHGGVKERSVRKGQEVSLNRFLAGIP